MERTNEKRPGEEITWRAVNGERKGKVVMTIGYTYLAVLPDGRRMIISEKAKGSEGIW